MTLIEKKTYPFTAIVGQEHMKLSLILNIINPSLGGVLIKGEKGTAKSTAVRGLVDILDEYDGVKNCRYNCYYNDEHNKCNDCKQDTSPEPEKRKKRVVELPIGATEDRVLGTLDMETAIKQGKKSFEPGILAMANNNILYVDEVNLLDDNIVDVLLDSAAMGVNTVEREGISYSHPARFILVGTMNPEEGELRPQLLDRFGLVVEVSGERDAALRKEVIKRRLAFEQDSIQFCKDYEQEQIKLGHRIKSAKDLLNQVEVTDDIYDIVAKMGIALEVDGHRADIALIKTATTIAAYNNELKVSKNHIERAAILVLPHRMRRLPFEESVLDMDKIRMIINE